MESVGVDEAYTLYSLDKLAEERQYYKLQLTYKDKTTRGGFVLKVFVKKLSF